MRPVEGGPEEHIEISTQLLEHIVAVAKAMDQPSVTQAGGGTFHTEKITFGAEGDPIKGIWLGWSTVSDFPAVFVDPRGEGQR